MIHPTFTAFTRLPFGWETFMEYPSVTRGRTFVDRMDEDGAWWFWVGRLAVVVSAPVKRPARAAADFGEDLSAAA